MFDLDDMFTARFTFKATKATNSNLMNDELKERSIPIQDLLGFVINLCVEATLAHRICELLDQLTGVFPSDTRVRDA
jgi:hypothetical protein